VRAAVSAEESPDEIEQSRDRWRAIAEAASPRADRLAEVLRELHACCVAQDKGGCPADRYGKAMHAAHQALRGYQR